MHQSIFQSKFKNFTVQRFANLTKVLASIDHRIQLSIVDLNFHYSNYFILGRWFYTNPKFQFPVSFRKVETVLDKTFSFCFVPDADYFGTVSMTVGPAFHVPGKKPILGTEEVTITININATNDRPVVTISLLDIPALPYNMSGYTNNGFLVSDLLKKTIRGVEQSAFTDKDGDTVGK